MYVDDELIENLRKAVDESTGTSSHLALLSAASEILAEKDREPQKIMDRDGDMWTQQSDGAWQMEGTEEDYTRTYVEDNYGPTRPIER